MNGSSLTADAAIGYDDTIIMVLREIIAIRLAIVLPNVR